MKLPIRILISVALLSIVLSPLRVLSVGAQEAPITQEQISRIRSSCVSAVNTLNQLHASDALLRVNRGELYESITSKLMVPFNVRVSRTPFNSNTLKTVTNDYQHELDAFRTDYQTYEVQLSNTLDISCSKQPVEFYNNVLESQSDRNKVYGDTTQLDDYITQYQTAVSEFKENYLPKSTGDTQ